MRINVGGVVKTPTKAQVDIGGVIKTITKAQANIGGVIKTLWQCTTILSNLCTGGIPLSGGDNGLYLKNYAFDGSITGTQWVSLQNGTSVHGIAYIGYTFASPVEIRGIKIKQTVGNGAVNSVKVQRYTSSWVDVATIALLTDGTFEVKVIPISGVSSSWRLLANADAIGGVSWNVWELEMYLLV